MTLERNAAILRLFKDGMPTKEIATRYGISCSRAWQIQKCAENRARKDAERSAVSPGFNLLPMRVQNALRNFFNGRTPTAKEVAEIDPSSLLDTPNLGKTSLVAVEEWLASQGLRMGGRARLEAELRSAQMHAEKWNAEVQRLTALLKEA